MDFTAFTAFTAKRAELQGTGVRDFTETRLARVVATIPELAANVEVAPVGYRCHVAEAWLARYAWPASWKSRTLVSRGVRHSLQCLFGVDAGRQRRWSLPSDVYPVYLELAGSAGLSFSTYSSIEQELIRPLEDCDTILVTEPCKPRGSYLTASELEGLLEWLRKAQHRRIVLDTVYDMALEPSVATRALLETQQCVVLHSLAKAWARPWLAGVALVPDDDVERLTPAFRSLEVDRAALALADALLRRDSEGPRRLLGWLATCADQAFEAWSGAGILQDVVTPSDPPVIGQYLFTVRRSWADLLEIGVLAIPGSAYGASAELNVLSTLPSLPLVLSRDR